MKKALYILPLLVLSALAITSGAGAISVENPQTVNVTTEGALGILNYVMRITYTVFFIIAVIFLLIAAFGYLTAGGDPAKVKKATNRLIYGIVAIAVALIATGIRALVQSFISTGQGG